MRRRFWRKSPIALKQYRPGEPNHVISLTLMPMLAEDLELLVDRLGTGPVKIVSRGYGSCRVQATAIHNVWSVQFFNAMDAILLDTIEIGDVPTAAQAADGGLSRLGRPSPRDRRGLLPMTSRA